MWTELQYCAGAPWGDAKHKHAHVVVSQTHLRTHPHTLFESDQAQIQQHRQAGVTGRRGSILPPPMFAMSTVFALVPVFTKLRAVHTMTAMQSPRAMTNSGWIIGQDRRTVSEL